MLASLVRLTVALVLVYGGVSGFMYVRQRDFMYFPDSARIAPAEKGFPQAHSVDLRTRDGENILAWWVPPAQPEKPVFLYLHGNAGNLSTRVERFQKLVGDGSGLLAVEWRGYGGSSGHPSEEGLKQDTLAAYQWLTEKISPKQVIVFGESLGSGPAVWLASRQPVAALVLDSPFVSMLAMAQQRYWYLPVGWLLKDTYRSDLAIRQVTVPVLVMHGDADPVAPFEQGQALFALAPEPRQFYPVRGGGHVDAYRYNGQEVVRHFVNGILR